MEITTADDLLDDAHFDFVIVGGGGAGATAAIEATDLGSSAIVLEKMGTTGGSTAVSGGSIRLLRDRSQAIEHLEYLSQGGTPRNVVTTFVDGLAGIPRWVADHGGELEPWNDEGVIGAYFPVGGPPQYRHLPLTSSIDARAHLRPTVEGVTGGAALWAFLERNVAERKVPVVVGARVTRLTQRFPERAILGVEVSTPVRTITLAAEVAVILCCGGFSQDAELKRQYFGLDVPAFSPPGRAEGDGIRLAQDVGADLWHMTAPAYNLGFASPDGEVVARISLSDFGFVLVDQRGERYECETELEPYSAARAMAVPDRTSGEFVRTPSYLVFDEVTRRAGPLGPRGRGYDWSRDNDAEVARGWIHRASSLGALASTLGMPIAALESTIAEFNGCAIAGGADRFRRPSERMRPIDEPPFYAIGIAPTLVNTQGGPRRDERGQILRPDGSPIPNLYGAGELGSVWNRLYPSGGNLAEVIVSGRLAVRSALGLSGWS